MWFKLTYGIHSMHMRRDDCLPAIMSTNSIGDEIVLWNRKLEGYPAYLCCDAVMSRNLNTKLQTMFDEFAGKKLPLESPPQLALPYDLSMIGVGPMIDEKGNIALKYHVPADIFPAAFQEMQDNLCRELANQIESFIKLMRWIQGASGKQSPFSFLEYCYSKDKINWTSMPHSTGVSVLETRGIDGRQGTMQSVREAWLIGMREPLGHELIREAIDVSLGNPRSALLIGLSALETGLKDYIQTLVPNSNYLLEKIPSPSVLTLVQEVIPNIHKSIGAFIDIFPLKKDDKEYLQKWVSQRNQVAHGLKSNLDQEKLACFLRFVRSTLYSLDFCKGNKWAGPHMRGTEKLY